MSDVSCEEITLDSWKPTKKNSTPMIVQSEWRKNHIGDNHNQQPGLDEIKKIMSFLKKKVNDSDIMKSFGVTAETLVAIKRGKYDPIDGISLDNQSKIYKKFSDISEEISLLKKSIDFIASVLFTDKEAKKLYKEALNKKKIGRKNKKNEEDE